MYNLECFSSAMLVLLIVRKPLVAKRFRQWKDVKDATHDISGSHEMKLDTVIMLIKNSCIKLKITNCTQNMTLQKIREFYAEWFRVCPNITSKFRSISIFRTS
jgi:hypothetical protein